MNRARLLAPLLCLIGCGGTEIQGQVGVLSFDMGKATFVNTTATTDGTGLTTTVLVLSTDGDMCEAIYNREQLQNTEALILDLGIISASTLVPPDVAGTYTIGAEFSGGEGDKECTGVVFASGLCLQISSVINASGGAVELTHVEVDQDGLPQRLVGTVSVDFPGGSLSGAFDATLCDPRVEYEVSFHIFVCENNQRTPGPGGARLVVNPR